LERQKKNTEGQTGKKGEKNCPRGGDKLNSLGKETNTGKRGAGKKKHAGGRAGS